MNEGTLNVHKTEFQIYTAWNSRCDPLSSTITFPQHGENISKCCSSGNIPRPWEKNTGENPSKTFIIHPDKSSVSQICFIIFHQDLCHFAERLNQQNKQKKMKEVCLLHLTETRCRVDLQHSFSSMLSKTSSGLSLFVGQPHVASP